MIRISTVTMTFGRAVAVDNVTIDIPAGDSVALWGVNGAGKTTLIRCVLGLLRHTGTITVGGHDTRRDGKHARRLIGYVPQELGFHDDLRVGEALAYFAALKGVPLDTPDAPLERVGLKGHDTKRIRELSGGMKQRLALAVAMLGDPPVLVLDEVTASLDACGRDEFVALLSRLSANTDSPRTMLFASHRVDEIGTLAKRVVMMEAGRVTEVLDARAFTDRLSQHGTAVLHLHMSVAVRPRAIDVLRSGGFSPSMNGVGVLVPVAHEHKAAPIRLLASASPPITIDDFEVLSPAALASHQEARP